MKYSPSELNFILDKYPKYRKKNQLSLNDAIVAFYKKYEVYVTPTKNYNALVVATGLNLRPSAPKA